MNAWKTMLVYTLLAMVAAPMFAPATNKAPQMVFRFVEENNMFKVKTAENAKQDELTLTDLKSSPKQQPRPKKRHPSQYTAAGWGNR